ncbi:MAG: IS110 family transposase [Pseudoxanthomonas suwonensis]|nr:MAG: IS110 family transposase [Pseudoxanthomonas suwonensis]
MTKVWAGVDAGKSAHHCVVISEDGDRLLSRRVVNNEPELLQLIADVCALATDVQWAIDLNCGGAGLVLAALAANGQRVVYIPGRVVYHAAAGYRGEGKTDAKDAAIIADQARIRRDLRAFAPADDVTAALRMLTSHRYDRMRARTGNINRLRALLGECFPALERELNLANSKAALILLTGYQSPAAIRRMGQSRLEAWLKKRKVRGSATLADKVIRAAHSQSVTVPGEAVAGRLVASLARCILDIEGELADLDRQITEVFREHRYAEVIESMPGFGPLLGAELLAATGGGIGVFENANRLAAMSGLAPVPKDSGRVSGNLHRPRRYDRRLMRVFYISAQLSARYDPNSEAYYRRKRAEGKRHTQAVITLARRRVNVLWAMLRDEREYAITSRKPLAA